VVSTYHRHHYAAAGQRHLADGWLLHQSGRKASADHLAGLAAECIMKAILLHFLGATMRDNRPTVGPSRSDSYGHMPGAWDQIALYAQGRAGAQFVSLITSPNPFSDWNVADRYLDGSQVRIIATHRHLRAADKLSRIYQHATLVGALP
jgi:hypothetical protein